VGIIFGMVEVTDAETFDANEAKGQLEPAAAKGLPEDGLRHVFSDPANAAGEIRTLLPAAVVDRIAWNTLTPVAGMFVDPELAELETDLLFRVALDGRDALLYVLLEHQSKTDSLLALRRSGASRCSPSHALASARTSPLTSNDGSTFSKSS